MYIFTKKVGFQQVYSSVLNVSKVPYPMCECGRITGELKPASSLSLTLNQLVLSLSPTLKQLVLSLSPTLNQLVLLFLL